METLSDLVGQPSLKELLQLKVQFARANAVVLPHLVFCGENASGKLTFASGVATELGAAFKSLAAGDMTSLLDLTGPFSNLHRGDVLAVTEVDSLKPAFVSLLTQALSTFHVPIVIGNRTHTLPMPQFTFIGTTCKPWLVDERLLRWCIPCQFAPYTHEEAAQIALRIGSQRGLILDEAAALNAAEQCHLKPGEISVFLQRVANHRAFGNDNRIDRNKLRQINAFLGSGSLYPALLTVADHLQTMSGVEFEHWVAELIRRSGFQVETASLTGDHGVDLWVSASDRLIAVQCKRWDGSIGEPLMRDLYGAMTAAKAQVGCLVSTGPFTAQAQQFAKDKPLHLIGLDFLLEAANSPEALSELLSRR